MKGHPMLEKLRKGLRELHKRLTDVEWNETIEADTEALAAATPQLLDALDDAEKPCVWRRHTNDDGDWSDRTTCGEVFVNFDVSADFCPNCGHRVEVAKP